MKILAIKINNITFFYLTNNFMQAGAKIVNLTLIFSRVQYTVVAGVRGYHPGKFVRNVHPIWYIILKFCRQNINLANIKLVLLISFRLNIINLNKKINTIYAEESTSVTCILVRWECIFIKSNVNTFTTTFIYPYDNSIF